MKRIFSGLLLCVFMSATLPGIGQIKSANKLYAQMKYHKAIPYYQKVISSKKTENREEAMVKLADCYRLTNRMDDAAKWYSLSLSAANNYYVVYLDYANVLRTLGRYIEARDFFKKYLDHFPKNQQARYYLDYCIEIEKWKHLPASASIKNVEDLNTDFSEFSPVINKNKLVFVSDRTVDLLDNNNFSWTGNGYLDLYAAEYNGNLDFAEVNIMSKPINQTFHDGPICFSPNDETVYITRTDKYKRYKKDSVQTHYSFIVSFDLAVSKPKAEMFPYNNIQHSVGHVAISPNGKMLIFASDLKGGFGESDFYWCMLNEKREWSEPQNLGETINTFGNEYFPYFINDSTLCFASDGHMGYGGLDLYTSTLENQTWSVPVNLKAPINSSFDDFGVYFTTRKEGFFSSNRPGGKGLDDIYWFEMKE